MIDLNITCSTSTAGALFKLPEHGCTHCEPKQWAAFLRLLAQLLGGDWQAGGRGFLNKAYCGLVIVGTVPGTVLLRIRLLPEDLTVPPAEMPVEFRIIDT